MFKRKFRSIAALTSAVLFVNAGICTFTASADSSESYIITSDEGAGVFVTVADTLNTTVDELLSNGEYTLILPSDLDKSFENINIITLPSPSSGIIDLRPNPDGYAVLFNKAPTKSVYHIGEELDITGAQIYYCYDNNELADSIFYASLDSCLENGMMTIDDSEFDNTKAGTYTIYVNYGTATASFEVTVTDEYRMRYSVHIEDSVLPSDIYRIMFNDFELNEFYANFTISGSCWLEDKDGNEFDKTEFTNKTLLEMIENETVTAELSKVFHCTNPVTGKDGIERELRVDYGDSWKILIFGMSNIEEQPSIEWKKQPQKTVYNYGEELDLSDAVVTLFDAENKDSEGVTGKLSDFIADGTVQINADNFYNCTEGERTIYIGYNDGYIEYDVEVLAEEPNGDANGDGNFTIADMVMVQKHIMGKKANMLSDWKCADFYKDGKIDVYDFIVMRENFVKNMK